MKFPFPVARAGAAHAEQADGVRQHAVDVLRRPRRHRALPDQRRASRTAIRRRASAGSSISSRSRDIIDWCDYASRSPSPSSRSRAAEAVRRRRGRPPTISAAPPPPVRPPAQLLRLPKKTGSVRFAAIGDSGRGDAAQYAVSAQMQAWRKEFPFDFVLMLGDNIYDSWTPEDYRQKFELPYKPLLDAGVKFYAAIGNHDDPNQPNYPLFNMGGKRYYTFKPPSLVARLAGTDVRFFMIDTERLDRHATRVDRSRDGGSNAEWKIAVFHRPIYTSGRYALPARAAARRARAAAVEARRQSGVFRARALLRADEAAAGHHVFHLRRRRVAAHRRHPPHRSDGGRLRSRLPLHAARDQRRRAVLPGDLRAGASIEPAVGDASIRSPAMSVGQAGPSVISPDLAPQRLRPGSDVRAFAVAAVELRESGRPRTAIRAGGR